MHGLPGCLGDGHITVHARRDRAQAAATIAILMRRRGLGHRDDQIHLGREVVEHGSAADPCFLHDQLGRGGRVADPAQAGDRCGLQPGDIAGLKALPMEALITAAGGSPYYGPVVDGRSLPGDPFEPDAPPLSRDIPMVDLRVLLLSSSSARRAVRCRSPELTAAEAIKTRRRCCQARQPTLLTPGACLCLS